MPGVVVLKDDEMRQVLFMPTRILLINNLFCFFLYLANDIDTHVQCTELHIDIQWVFFYTIPPDDNYALCAASQSVHCLLRIVHS